MIDPLDDLFDPEDDDALDLPLLDPLDGGEPEDDALDDTLT
jgi:hypothetical protein